MYIYICKPALVLYSVSAGILREGLHRVLREACAQLHCIRVANT